MKRFKQAVLAVQSDGATPDKSRHKPRTANTPRKVNVDLRRDDKTDARSRGRREGGISAAITLVAHT